MPPKTVKELVKGAMRKIPKPDDVRMKPVIKKSVAKIEKAPKAFKRKFKDTVRKVGEMKVQ